MFKIRYITLAVCTALSSYLAACGGGGGGDAPAASTTPADPGAQPTGTQTGGSGTGSSGSSSSGTGSSSGSTTGSTGSTGTSTPAVTTTVYGNLRGASLGLNASLNGAVPFPADNAWNTDISQRPVDPNSDNIIASIGAGTSIHPDFGSEKTYGGPIGIPYVVVSGSQPKVPMHWTAYGDESDPGPYPVPPTAPIEGGPSSTGDRHVLVIDRDNNRLYELGNGFYNLDGSWNANCGAIFFLDSNNVRPGGQPGWTSTDAAGLPIFPGLARYEEAAAGPGGIKHALRFTVRSSRKAYVPPATHWASSNTSVNLAPMGMRVRLKASYVIPSTFTKETRALLTAMKTYGLIVADNGGNWFVSGAPDDRWNNDKLVSELAQVKGSNFEVVRMDGLVHP